MIFFNEWMQERFDEAKKSRRTPVPHSDIEKWNNLIEAFAQDENLKVLDISNILFKENDFTSEIEPSEIGGEKLANQIALISI